MSEIPYFFETPVPKYFRENGWYKNPNTILFLTWAFAKCSIEPRTIVHDSKEIKLQPFEFITGRGKSSADCFLTEDAFKHQLKILQNAGFLKKTPNSVPNRYTCYVWVTELFCKHNTQLNSQLNANCAPTERPQSRYKKIRYKEDHHPSIPSNRDDGTDDFFSNSDFCENETSSEIYQEKTLSDVVQEKIVDFPSEINDLEKQHNIQDQTLFTKCNVKKTFKHKKTYENNKKQIIPGVLLTNEELDECIAIKGSEEAVINAINLIQNNPKRLHEIQNWPRTLANWKISSQGKPNQNAKKNEQNTKKFEDKIHSDSVWKFRHYKNTIKDCAGILFYSDKSSSIYSETIFIPYADAEFNEKVQNLMKEKKVRYLK